ncbi:cation diffusion facilitator family transporter [Vittaforma corneae ATCC 50505]|uniref:Cation diffusion facilitator family transporter n=1 Tax=Vittaforma corneae (strain ATCC 50505) TaxID=993615 RepID=L2GN98_VITCO|nr:cation diffusion facilitator family transporter [Vittaforma corneae ATCC 50505]ELA41787.1 cation diffusion facilitator family transporter [Vittaforma corneae ATCC 50505]
MNPLCKEDCEHHSSCLLNSVESAKSHQSRQSSHYFCSHDRDIKKISIVFVFICIFMIVELWGHLKTGSLSLLADSLHLLVDISGFIVSIITLRLSKRMPDNKMMFGYERTEIIGALFSVFFIWAAVIYLIAESIHKYLHPKEIDGKTFLTIAVAGLIVNVLCMLVLHHNHSDSHAQCNHIRKKQNLNMRATYVHVIGDIIQSIGVLIASVIIFFFPSAVIADVLCTVFFAGLVLFSTYFIVRDAIRILSEGAPENLNVEEIKQKILAMDRVIKIMDIKVWSVSVNKTAMSIKILIDHVSMREYESILVILKEYLSKEKTIDFVNIQIDTPLTNQESSGFEIQGLSIKNIM